MHSPPLNISYIIVWLKLMRIFMVGFLNNLKNRFFLSHMIATLQPKAVLCIMALPIYEQNYN